jgi:hypothetical protein
MPDPQTKAAQLAVRAGDLMQVGTDLRLAITIAEMAINNLPQNERAAAMRALLERLKR